MTEIKEKANKKDADSEKEELHVLQTSVGNFGAKIKDLTIDVETLKEHLHKIQATEEENKTNISKIMVKYYWANKKYSFNNLHFSLGWTLS